MLIKIVKNGVESEWFQLTKRIHRELLLDRPEMVVVHIADLYEDSPDDGMVIELDFDVFSVIAREFVLEANRQAKQDERHLIQRSIDHIDLDRIQVIPSAEDECIKKIEIRRLYKALESLTAAQRCRLKVYIEEGLSLQEIADKEGVMKNAIACSIRLAKEKIKNF